jgi:hypothetical protein
MSDKIREAGFCDFCKCGGIIRDGVCQQCGNAQDGKFHATIKTQGNSHGGIDIIYGTTGNPRKLKIKEVNTDDDVQEYYASKHGSLASTMYMQGYYASGVVSIFVERPRGTQISCTLDRAPNKIARAFRNAKRRKKAEEYVENLITSSFEKLVENLPRD